MRCFTLEPFLDIIIIIIFKHYQSDLFGCSFDESRGQGQNM